jgi:hypothetical protein
MSFSDALKKLGKYTTDNSPAILSAIGAAGVVTTAYFAAKASFKVERILQDEMEIRISRAGSINRVEPMSRLEKLKLSWPHYIPAIGVGCISVGCIIMANGINTRRAAGLATAFALSERAFDEYKEKVVEKLGDSKERDLRDEIAQERITKSSNLGDTFIVGEGSVLCFESFTGRYFLSSMEELKKAQNNVNYKVLNDYYASLTDFYNEIATLERTSYSDEVGWNSDKMMELLFSATITDGGKPCIVVDYHVTPIRDYYRVQ